MTSAFPGATLDETARVGSCRSAEGGLIWDRAAEGVSCNAPMVLAHLVRRISGSVVTPAVVVTALASLAVWIYLATHITFNNDEAIQFYPLFCATNHFPSLSDSIGRCDELRLRVHGVWLPLRAYQYIGFSSALFFFPVWSLIDDPIAIRVWTGILWFANSLLLSRILLAPWPLVMGVVMMSVPVVAQHVTDTGPSTLQIAFIQIGVLCLLRALQSSRLLVGLLFGAAAGVCAFLAFEQKPFVVYGAPLAAYLVLVGYSRRSRLGGGRELAVRGAAFAIGFSLLFAPLVWTLLHARVPDRGRYLSALRAKAGTYSLDDISRWFSHCEELLRTYFFFPVSYFHRSYQDALVSDPFARSIVPGLVIVMVGVAVLALLARGRQWRALAIVLVGVGLAFVALFFIAQSSNAWAGHHTIFAHLILFVALAFGLRALVERHRVVVMLLVATLLCANLKPTWDIAHAKPDARGDPTRLELLALTHAPAFASEYMVVHASWGMFYLDAVFSPPTYAVARGRGYSKKLRKVAASINRKLALLMMKNSAWDAIAVQQGFKLLAESSSGTWQLWVEDGVAPSDAPSEPFVSDTPDDS